MYETSFHKAVGTRKLVSINPDIKTVSALNHRSGRSSQNVPVSFLGSIFMEISLIGKKTSGDLRPALHQIWGSCSRTTIIHSRWHDVVSCQDVV